MFDVARNKIAALMRGRFVRRQDGAAAVEFALIAAPFLALTFAILETAFVFFAGQVLETAAADSARLIMTGQAQTAGYSAAEFKTQVCARIFGLFDCEKIYVNVKSYSTFAAVSGATSPVVNGQFDASKMAYEACGPGKIEVVTLYYQWPIYVLLLGNTIANLNGGKRLLAATAVFRVEPYGSTGPC